MPEDPESRLNNTEEGSTSKPLSSPASYPLEKFEERFVSYPNKSVGREVRRQGYAFYSQAQLLRQTDSRSVIPSILQQFALVFTGLSILLIYTGGNPPGWLMATAVAITIAGVTWIEYRRTEWKTHREKAKLLLDKKVLAQNILASSETNRNLLNADLSSTFLARASLVGATLNRANLTGTTLIKANLSRALLKEAILTEAVLVSADLSGADLSRANLTKANLMGANLRGANLTEANLAGADLCSVNFTEANLMGANLTNTMLQSTNFASAEVSQTLFTNDSKLGDRKKADLIQRGAIFVDDLDSTSTRLTRG